MYVRVGNDVSEWFLVSVRLRQCCVMCPWLFNIHMDGMVQEVNVRALGKELELLSAKGGRFEINQLLFATLSIRDTPTKLLEHFISITFTFHLSALLIPHASTSHNAIGKITPSHRHFFVSIIPNPLLLSILLRGPYDRN